MYDRDELQTFFTNLAAGIALQSKNTDLPKKDKIEGVDARA